MLWNTLLSDDFIHTRSENASSISVSSIGIGNHVP